MMKSQNIWRYTWIVLIISVALGVLIHFESLIFNFIPDTGNSRVNTRQVNLADTLSDVFISSMVAFFTFIINYYIIRPLDSNLKIGWKKLSVSVIVTIVTITILSDLFFSLQHQISARDYQEKLQLLYTFRDIYIAIVVITGVYFIKTVNDRQAIRIENEKLRNENLLSQYESLKQQVSPHFLFNSLTSLKELISQNPSKAQEYVNHLSLVMRYTLQSNENITQSLKDELEVAESYFFLAKIRYGNNLLISKKINSLYDFYLLPPLAVQTLLENAIKHNEISKRSPLTIRIETTDAQSLSVTNNLQLKISPESGTGIGLSNLSRRYKFLSGNDITISQVNNEFRVELPLIKSDKDESSNS